MIQGVSLGCVAPGSRPASARQGNLHFKAAAAFAVVPLLLLIVSPPAYCKKIPPAAPLDLNSATASQLQQLPGIGPTAAQAIVRFREKSGPFRRVEDLLAIRGISPQKLARLRPYVMVSPKRLANP